MKNGISMIPFGLLSGFMDGKEIRIIELAEEGFRFRLAEKAASPESFLVCFYDMEQADYHEIEIRNYTIEEDNVSSELVEFCMEYTVLVNSESYKQEVRKLQGQYSRYIRLKLEDDDEELARALTEYPEKKPVNYYSLEERQNYSLETAIEIDRPELYREYLQNDIKQLIEQCYEWKRITGNQLDSNKQNDSPDNKSNIGHGLNLNRIYIGNQFCHLLFPDEKELFMMLEKAYKESLGITIAFSYIREFMLKPIEELINRLAQWCKEKDTCIEIVINDWAMADIIAKQNAELAIKKSEAINEMRQYLIPCLGILLNKRKKDPRFPYKKGDKSLYSQNNLNADFYRKYLQSEFGIQRYEWESCGYEQEFPQGKNSLHLPYYQTNTSQYCPLYAICTTGNRGIQYLVKECSHYCSIYRLSYPKHLNITGRFNSLFGIDKELLNHPEKIKAYANAGIDRLVIGWE
ncbi:hypothetical protein [Blautia sp. MSJ-9]|uniref:hypothetical protein n=1 Tax=Blautia sp. MSJ-9 TaxID=2841511 RepID=UPI001C0FAF1C|nr:hypothetical protein [Blautia sp. MSJ-9]MBU5681832.1 hypothetical protein [Blautia sp. MSJ-9]